MATALTVDHDDKRRGRAGGGGGGGVAGTYQLALARPGSRFRQFIVATVPLCIVSCYFLYAATVRSRKPIYLLDDDDVNGNEENIVDAIESTGRLIPLFDIVRTFVLLELQWLVLFFYVWIFVPRRRALMKSYLKGGGGGATTAESNLGNVIYDHKPSFFDRFFVVGLPHPKQHGFIEYVHPSESSSSSSSKTSSSKTSSSKTSSKASTRAQDERNARKQSLMGGGEGEGKGKDKRYRRRYVRKKVRIYQHFSRENVTILRLPGRPFSGQPKTDVEIDVRASEGGREQTGALGWYSIGWAIFCLGGAIYVWRCMCRLDLRPWNDRYENVSRATLWIYAGGMSGAPFLAFLFIMTRWILHRHWIVNRGMVVSRDADENDDDHDDERGGRGGGGGGGGGGCIGGCIGGGVGVGVSGEDLDDSVINHDNDDDDGNDDRNKNRKGRTNNRDRNDDDDDDEGGGGGDHAKKAFWDDLWKPSTYICDEGCVEGSYEDDDDDDDAEQNRYKALP